MTVQDQVASCPTEVGSGETKRALVTWVGGEMIVLCVPAQQPARSRKCTTAQARRKSEV